MNQLLRLRFVVGQLNFIVGDIQGNAQRIIDATHHAKHHLGADLIIFPELALCGYPPEDLLLRPDFQRQLKTEMTRLLQEMADIDMILGCPLQKDAHLYNAAAFIENHQIRQFYMKHHLPNYGVFDEKRYFTPGEALGLFNYHGLNLAMCICEDLWDPNYRHKLSAANIDLVISLNASPFDVNKSEHRQEVMRQCAINGKLGIIYAHCVGGQDEVVFDGGSFAINAEGTLSAQGVFFQEELLAIDLICQPTLSIQQKIIAKPKLHYAHVYDALVLATRDYVVKNNFKGALLGLSGGIDSALTLCIAVDALGADNVTAVMMPSEYTASMSQEDAALLASNLGVHYECLSIQPMVDITLATLKNIFSNTSKNATEENIQSRCRGLLLMALSNKFGRLVLTTGNKSEMAMGYATLYGDMAGGFAVLKDVEKMRVYELAQYRNTVKKVIPQRIIDREPSAELAHGQVDQDSLPPYPLLDKILQRYVEDDQSLAQIVNAGFDRDMVKQVIDRVDANEYKRRQAPPGIRITARAFGRDRRYPITSKFKTER
jgi:NAD+ synthase (glutamine-hydrolysing)